MTATREALFEAHVAHALAALQGDALALRLRRQIDALFEWMADVELADVATPERVLGAIDRFVIELRVSGGITELAGEMARVVFRAGGRADVRVDEVFFAESYEEFADKLLAFDTARAQIVSLVVQSSALGDVTARVLTRGATEVLRRRLAHLPGLSDLLQRRLWPELESRVGALVARHLESHREQYAAEAEKILVELLDERFLRALLDDLWQGLSRLRLDEAFGFLQEQDIEDFVVFCYEYWLRLRKTGYFRQMLTEAVEFFFTKYGPESLATLVEDMGVSASMVSGELETFLVPLLDHAARTGFLEQQVRLELASFYDSPEFAAALARGE